MPRSVRTTLEQAGLRPDARLPLRQSPFPVPPVLGIGSPADGPMLAWRWPVDDQEVRFSDPLHNVGTLLRFARLPLQDDEGILEFARREGVLELCEAHGLSAYHRRTARGMDYREFRIHVEEMLGRLDGPTEEDFRYFRQLLRDGGLVTYDQPSRLFKEGRRSYLLTNAPSVTLVTPGPIRRGEPDEGEHLPTGEAATTWLFQAGYGEEPCSPRTIFPLRATDNRCYLSHREVGRESHR